MDGNNLSRERQGGEKISRRDFLRRSGYTGLAIAGGGLAAACGAGGSEGNGTSGNTAVQGGPAATTGSSSGGTGGASGAVTFTVWGDAEAAAGYKTLVDAFKKEHPNIDLRIQPVPGESWAGFFDAVSTRIAGGQIPDVIRVATEGQRLFTSRGLVEPLDPYIDTDRGELQEFFDDVHPNLMEWTRSLSSTDGKTYYLPHGFNTMCMWYSKPLFQQAGLKEPTDDWTWNDFLYAAEKVTKPGRVFGMHMPPAYFSGAMPWLLTNGASTMNADWTKSTVADPKAIQAANFMRSLIEKGISPKPGGEYDAFGAMAQGRLAMFGAGRWPTGAMRELNYVDKIGIVAWPQKERKGSPVGWDAHPIMKDSQNKDAAWEFVKFLASKRAQEIEVLQGGATVPPRRSVAQSEAFLGNAPEGMTKLYEALSYATPIPSPNKGNVIERDIIDTFTQILAGNAKPEQALKELDQKIQANL
ncbi:MAG: sugar ABC transporter substrate-binding protein [Actinobacteria bacterium]|nr:MAG: sugar ABC transporter substrate-binding protein [Actinomycetota bacterium]